MKARYSIALAFGFTLTSMAQTNISLLGHLSYQDSRQSDLANIWGYTDEEGNEYALVGVDGDGSSNSGGLSVVDVTDPANPVEVFFAPGPPSPWREVKVWNNHAYTTTEAQGGLQIVDLSPLPQSTNLSVTTFWGDDWTTSHSLFIDENGRLYIHGANRGNGGVIMYDLTADPEAPVEVGEYDQLYCHDSYARGDTLYAAHVYDGIFSIIDVSDPASPILLGTSPSPDQFTHNVWLDDSGQYLFSTDEVSSAYVGAFDITDPSDIQQVDKLRSDNGSGTIPHNTYWLNHFLVTSYYTYGVVIYDATHPDNLVEVGHYDTSPYSGDGFHGDWGVYPFLPSGNLLVSDIEGGLYILAPDYVHATWLTGSITAYGSGTAINQATITLSTDLADDVTGFDGQYAMGLADAGTYTVTVEAAGYPTVTVNNVALVTGETTVLDVVMGDPNVGVSEHVDQGTPLQIVPNPCDGDFSLRNGEHGRSLVEVMDLQGRPLLPMFEMVDGSASFTTHLSTGAYLLRVQDENGRTTVNKLMVR